MLLLVSYHDLELPVEDQIRSTMKQYKTRDASWFNPPNVSVQYLSIFSQSEFQLVIKYPLKLGGRVNSLFIIFQLFYLELFS